MIDTLQIYQDLSETLDERTARKLATFLGAVYADLQQAVTKEDFRDLKQTVADLAEAQKALTEAQRRTEARVAELGEAQQRTEMRVAELVEAQKRTDARLESLAEAQGRTDARLESLAEAQRRTEMRVGELAEGLKALSEAQQRTEMRVAELAEAQKRTQQQFEKDFRDLDNRFGVLGSRWGKGAEAAFREGLLETVRELGYTVEHYHGEDSEGFINYAPRSYDLDVLVHNGHTVVAEIKSNASGADVTEFHRAVLLFERQTGRTPTKRVLVAVTLQQAALERARELGVIVATDFAALE